MRCQPLIRNKGLYVQNPLFRCNKKNEEIIQPPVVKLDKKVQKNQKSKLYV